MLFAEFEWRRAPHATIDGDSLLLSSDDLWEEPYHPLHSHPALFHDFADLEDTSEAIATFAKEYGPLGVADWGSDVGLEPLESWRREIHIMRDLLKLWSEIEAKDVIALRRRIKPQEGIASRAGEEVDPDLPSPTLYLHVEGDEPPLHAKSGKGIDLEIVERYGRGFDAVGTLDQLRGTKSDPVGPCLDALVMRLTRILRADCSPAMRVDRETRTPRIVLEPATLLGALWLQFAAAVNGNKRYEQCPQCGSHFELSPERSRSDRKYCSNTCKQRAYVKRKQDMGGDHA